MLYIYYAVLFVAIVLGGALWDGTLPLVPLP